jgi:transposase InsO family protein
VEALREAVELYGRPEIFNTDQGSQYTGKEFIVILQEANIRISMNGRGRALDNVMLERLWRTVDCLKVRFSHNIDLVWGWGWYVNGVLCIRKVPEDHFSSGLPGSWFLNHRKEDSYSCDCVVNFVPPVCSSNIFTVWIMHLRLNKCQPRNLRFLTLPPAV